MGREIKRVALDFDWPLGFVWKGYVNPYRAQECKPCSGTGENPATKQLSDDWYDFAQTGRRWCNKITQDEVDALIAQRRLVDFTHHWVLGKGWVEISPRPVVTAEMVNTRFRDGLGHDAINRWICVETRAKRLGVYGVCHVCQGEGVIFFNERIRQLHEAWDEKERYDPPNGEGWQVWETVSEGSPMTPVLPTAEALVDYLVEHGDKWDEDRQNPGWDRANAEKFVSAGFALSGVMKVTDGKVEVLAPRDGS